MRLRADGDGMTAHGTIRVKPGDPNFEAIFGHVGRPDVGASFSVRPFPD